MIVNLHQTWLPTHHTHTYCVNVCVSVCVCVEMAAVMDASSQSCL